MKALKKTLAVLLAVLMVLAVCPSAFAAVDTTGIEIGDVVTFGIYEQDNNSDTADALEWIVVGKDGDALKLITKYILNTTVSYATQKTFTGAWGNFNSIYKNFIPGFIAEAFTAKEKAAIIPTENGATDVVKLKDDAGNELEEYAPLGPDLVYLPTAADLAVFETDEARIAENTAVAAKTKGATAEGEGANYFIREETYEQRRTYYVSYVDGTGAIHLAVEEKSTDFTVVKIGEIGTRLMVNVDASKLYTFGKDDQGRLPLVGTLGTYTVTWCDSDGTVVYTELVDHGDLANEPTRDMIIVAAKEIHAGYEWTGWDKDITAPITEDTTFTAAYELIPKKSVFEQIGDILQFAFDFVFTFIQETVFPVVREWIEANLGVEIPW